MDGDNAKVKPRSEVLFCHDLVSEKGLTWKEKDPKHEWKLTTRLPDGTTFLSCYLLTPLDIPPSFFGRMEYAYTNHLVGSVTYQVCPFLSQLTLLPGQNSYFLL